MKKFVIYNITNDDFTHYIGAENGSYVSFLKDALKFESESQAWSFLFQFSEENNGMDLDGCSVIEVFISKPKT
jgi:hypothetical protein